MMIKPGRLRRTITFQSKQAISGGRLNAPQRTDWTNHAVGVAAEVQDVLPSRAESIGNDAINIARRPSRIRIRYRTDITSDMRILYEGKTLRIVAGPAEIGNREGLELMAEEVTSGEEVA
jgi:SPP1 family predicted phage head-tail adaptor